MPYFTNILNLLCILNHISYFACQSFRSLVWSLVMNKICWLTTSTHLLYAIYTTILETKILSANCALLSFSSLLYAIQCECLLELQKKAPWLTCIKSIFAYTTITRLWWFKFSKFFHGCLSHHAKCTAHFSNSVWQFCMILEKLCLCCLWFCENAFSAIVYILWPLLIWGKI